MTTVQVVARRYVRNVVKGLGAEPTTQVEGRFEINLKIEGEWQWPPDTKTRPFIVHRQKYN